VEMEKLVSYRILPRNHGLTLSLTRSEERPEAQRAIRGRSARRVEWRGTDRPGPPGPAGPPGPQGPPGRWSLVRIVRSNCDATSCAAQCGDERLCSSPIGGSARTRHLSDRAGPHHVRAPQRGEQSGDRRSARNPVTAHAPACPRQPAEPAGSTAATEESRIGGGYWFRATAITGLSPRCGRDHDADRSVGKMAAFLALPQLGR